LDVWLGDFDKDEISIHGQLSFSDLSHQYFEAQDEDLSGDKAAGLVTHGFRDWQVEERLGQAECAACEHQGRQHDHRQIEVADLAGRPRERRIWIYRCRLGQQRVFAIVKRPPQGSKNMLWSFRKKDGTYTDNVFLRTSRGNKRSNPSISTTKSCGSSTGWTIQAHEPNSTPTETHREQAYIQAPTNTATSQPGRNLTRQLRRSTIEGAAGNEAPQAPLQIENGGTAQDSADSAQHSQGHSSLVCMGTKTKVGREESIEHFDASTLRDRGVWLGYDYEERSRVNGLSWNEVRPQAWRRLIGVDYDARVKHLRMNVWQKNAERPKLVHCAACAAPDGVPLDEDMHLGELSFDPASIQDRPLTDVQSSKKLRKLVSKTSFLLLLHDSLLSTLF
jgi:hypothetical protein